MEPRIQYAKTEDGVSIAFWTMGEGEPLVHLPLFGAGHLQMEWQYPDYRRWYERLADKRRLVRFDVGGTGLSDRNVVDFSLDARLPDLEAVVDLLGLEKFALCGFVHSGPAAISYAVRHPERVTHLILWCPYARGTDYLTSSPAIPVLTAARDDFDTYLELAAHLAVGWSEGEQARGYVAYLREWMTPELLGEITDAIPDYDVTGLLPQVKSPTLVLHRRQCPFPDMDSVQRLASEIPGAQLAVLEGKSLIPFLGDTDALIQVIDEFLDDGKSATVDLPSGTAVILFLDIAGSTELTTKLGDAAYREKERKLDASLRAAITEAGGTPVEGKVLGDGIMAVFTSARQAIDAAQGCRDLGNDAGLPLHLGIHAGDVVREGNNVHGGAVQVAARVQSAADPDEILVSATVRDLARTSAGVAFEDRGEHELKGINEPQRLFAVQAEGSPEETAD